MIKPEKICKLVKYVQYGCHLTSATCKPCFLENIHHHKFITTFLPISNISSLYSCMLPCVESFLHPASAERCMLLRNCTLTIPHIQTERQTGHEAPSHHLSSNTSMFNRVWISALFLPNHTLQSFTLGIYCHTVFSPLSTHI